MTATLERIANEVRKLSPPELDQLRAWVMEYQPASGAEDSSVRVDWSGHATRIQEIFAENTSVRENAVLALRKEERF